MAVWEQNARRYEARLQAFGYICVNFYRYVEFKDNGEPVVPMGYPHWGDLPEECRENYADLDCLVSAMDSVRAEVKDSSKHCIDIDFLLGLLNWSFNPADLDGLRMVYTAPKDPRKRIGKRGHK